MSMRSPAPADTDLQHEVRAQETSALGSNTSGSQARSRGGAAVLVLLAALVVSWCALIARFGDGNVYAVIGPYAAGVSLILVALRPQAILSWLRPSKRAIAVGLAVGALMTLLTYPVFQLCAALYPPLESHVQALYGGARSASLAAALGWVLAVILAEELLFRGVLPDELSGRLSERNAFGLSLLLYALAQLGTGSFIVMLMALACGGIWTLQRRYTGSLLSSLIAHVIWTPTVILLYPVT